MVVIGHCTSLLEKEVAVINGEKNTLASRINLVLFISSDLGIADDERI